MTTRHQRAKARAQSLADDLKAAHRAFQIEAAVQKVVPCLCGAKIVARLVRQAEAITGLALE